MLVRVDDRDIGRKTWKGHGGILLLYGLEKAGHLTGWNESVKVEFRGDNLAYEYR